MGTMPTPVKMTFRYSNFKRYSPQRSHEKLVKMVKHKLGNNPEALAFIVSCRMKGHEQYSSVSDYGTKKIIKLHCDICGLLAVANIKIKGKIE